jgi:hypothetical protein
MDPEELAKEIARRKQVAKDLNLRELVSRFYSSHLQYHSENVKKGPDAILSALKDTLTIKGTRYSLLSMKSSIAKAKRKRGDEGMMKQSHPDPALTRARLSPGL